MLLSNLAKIIYCKGTASENTVITVKSHTTGELLWCGIAKKLSSYTKDNPDWIVIEVLVDKSDKENLADYNKGKIVTVI